MAIIALEDGRFLEVNDAFSRITGYIREELHRNTIYSLGIYHDREQLEDTFEILRHSGSVRDFDIKLATKSGELRDIILSFETSDLDDRPVVFAYFFDITLRSALEEDLRRNQSRVRSLAGVLEEKVAERTRDLEQQTRITETLMNTSPAGILRLSQEGKINYANQKALEIFGVDSEEIMGMYYNEAGWNASDFSGKPLAEESYPFQVIQSTKLPVNNIQVRVKSKEGMDRYLLVNGSPLFSPEGNFEGTVVAFMDISRQVQKESELRKQENMMIQQAKMATIGQMLAAISHQWKQPLNAISIIIQDLQEAYNAGELDKRYIDQSTKEIIDHVIYLSKNVSEFRSFFTTSRHSLNFELSEVLEEFCQLVSGQLQSLDIELTFEKIDQGPWSVTGIPGEFKHALLNIVNNSREAVLRRRKRDKEFAVRKGSIAVFLDRSDEQSVIRIEDNGGGIDPEVLSTLFEPYVTTSPEKSFGLGLYMTRLIIAQMEGVISASNCKEGAVFTIRLPGPRSDVDFL